VFDVMAAVLLLATNSFLLSTLLKEAETFTANAKTSSIPIYFLQSFLALNLAYLLSLV